MFACFPRIPSNPGPHEEPHAVSSPQKEVASRAEAPLLALRRLRQPPDRPLQEVLASPEEVTP